MEPFLIEVHEHRPVVDASGKQARCGHVNLNGQPCGALWIWSAQPLGGWPVPSQAHTVYPVAAVVSAEKVGRS